MNRNKKNDPICITPEELIEFLTSSQSILQQGLEELQKISSETIQNEQISKSLTQFECAILEKVTSEEKRLQTKLIDIRNCINTKLPKNQKESDDLKKEVDGLINEVKGLLDEMKNMKKKKCG